MKTFAAAAIAATSASAFDVISVPDFVAGFIYGMTGDNHLTEIEACYQGGESIATDVQTALADFEGGNYFAGLKDAGTAWTDINVAMATCQGMSDDVASIEAWAQIFTNPAELSKTVAKHWVFHGSQIKADISQEESDWSAGSYFDAGVDTAKALTLAVGPIKSTNEASNLTIKPELEFVAGLLEGLVGDNHLTEISTCVTDSESVVTEVENLVADLKAGKKIRAAAAAKKLVADFPATLSACEGMGTDLTAVEVWAKQFASPKTLVKTISKHMVMHHTEIMADVTAVETDWNAKEYFNSGKAAADLLTVAIGPIEASNNLDLQLDLLMLPELAAGFVYGMVGDNHLAEMESCYSGVTPLYGFLETALTDLESFKIFSAIKQLEAFTFHFQEDVAPCKSMSEDIAAIELWAQAFKAPKTLAASVAKHYVLHKRAVTKDIAAVRTDWAAKSYFSTGKDAADLVTVLVGSIE